MSARTPGPRCTASTHADIWHPSTCNRFAVKDGFCKQHHPDEIKARQDASYAAYKNKMENTPLAKLQRSHDTLTAQVAALREALRVCITDEGAHCYQTGSVHALDCRIKGINAEARAALARNGRME